jgi:hypothetical protein
MSENQKTQLTQNNNKQQKQINKSVQGTDIKQIKL